MHWRAELPLLTYAGIWLVAGLLALLTEYGDKTVYVTSLCLRRLEWLDHDIRGWARRLHLKQAEVHVQNHNEVQSSSATWTSRTSRHL